MTDIETILSRNVNMTRSHNRDSYGFEVLALTQKARAKVNANKIDSAAWSLQEIQKISARQLMANGHLDWKSFVLEVLQDESISEIVVEDKYWAWITAYASLYMIDTTNLWHVANIIAISATMESLL